MTEAATNRCAGCQRLQAQVEDLTLQLQQVQATVAHLQEQLAAARQDSATSSLRAPFPAHRQAAAAAPSCGPEPTPARRSARSSQTRTRSVPSRAGRSAL